MSNIFEYQPVEVDPITFEVIRHRLLSITDEQASTLASVSGSSLVNEATDFNTGLYRAFGEVVTMGKTVTFHAASLSLMVKHVIEDCEESIGINPGDMFIVNHPHKGALHCPDIGILAPIFYEGKRIGWTGNYQGNPGKTSREFADDVERRWDGIADVPAEVQSSERVLRHPARPRGADRTNT